MSPPEIAQGSQEYLWWSAGANDEAKARNEGMSTAAREARETLEALARLDQSQSAAGLVTALARIFCPDRLRMRYR